MAGGHRRSAEGGVADDDLLLGNDLCDLVVVAEAVLQAQDHGVLVDHRQRVADGRLKILVMHEHDEQVHHADLLRVGGRHGGMERERFAGTDAGHALIHKNAVLLNGLDHGGIGVQNADLVFLAQNACIAAADRAAADKSDLHDIISF